MKVPYISAVESIAELKKEYEAGSAVYLRKIDRLARMYSSLRRTRGDGNCFFRGFIFAYLEGLVRSNDVTEARRLEQCIRDWKPKLLSAGYQELVFEDAMDLLLEQVASIGRPQDPMSRELLEVNFCDDGVSNMIVMFLRMVTSGELVRREDFFAPFIMGMYDDPPATVELFCRRYVECMGEESDHVHIQAVTDALEVPVRVVYLDRSEGAVALQQPAPSSSGAGGAEHDVDVSSYDFVPEACQKRADQQGRAVEPRCTLLYRPGHYDVLYSI